EGGKPGFMLSRSPSPDAGACLYWLCYSRAGRIDRVVIIAAHALIGARMRAAIAGLDDGAVFTEGHCLDAERAALVPSDLVGRRLSLRRAGPPPHASEP